MSAQPATAIGIERSHLRYRMEVALLGLLSMLGLVAFFDRILLAPTAETWGLFTANYLFLLGLTQFGVGFSAMMRVCGAGWPAAFFRLGDLIALAFIPFALVGFLVIFVLGREHMFFWIAAQADGETLSGWLDARGLLLRNLGAQALFYALALVYFVNALSPDLQQDAADDGPRWRRALYRRLLARKARRAEEPATLRRRLTALAVALLAAGVLAQTFLAWDFGMMLYPHYHSSVFSMHFIMSSIFAGTAALLLIHSLVSRYVPTDTFVTVQHLHNMGTLLTGFTLLWLYLWWSQYFVSWFGNQDFHMDALRAQMEGHYAPLFWTMMALVFFIPLIALIFRKVKRMPRRLLLVCGAIVVGIWINRYLTVMPALSENHRLFSSFAEIMVTVGWFASYLLMLLLLLQVFPAIARWESFGGDTHRTAGH